MSEDREITPKETPHKIWWFGHFWLWIITGLICYVLYKDTNPQAARSHLIHSIWFPIVAWIAIYIVIIIVLDNTISDTSYWL